MLEIHKETDGLLSKMYRLLKLPMWYLALHLDLGFWIACLMKLVDTMISNLWKGIRQFGEVLRWKYYWDTEFYWATHWPRCDDESKEDEKPALAGR